MPNAFNALKKIVDYDSVVIYCHVYHPGIDLIIYMVGYFSSQVGKSADLVTLNSFLFAPKIIIIMHFGFAYN